MFGRLKTVGQERVSGSSLKIKKISVDSSPTDFFLKIHEKYDNAFLLESMTGPKKLARFSFIGRRTDPFRRKTDAVSEHSYVGSYIAFR